MNEKTEPEKEYPYIDRPMWLYSRSSDKKILALMQQMHELLEEAQRRSYTVVGTSQDMGTGRSMARMGLQQMMRSVKEGHVRAVLVRDLTRLSHDPAVLIQILLSAPKQKHPKSPVSCGFLDVFFFHILLIWSLFGHYELF